MGKVCRFCNPVSAQKHAKGCPEAVTPSADALKAWNRGYQDAISGMSQAEAGNDSYLLGHSMGLDDIKKGESVNPDPNAGFEGIEFEDMYLDG